MRFGSVCSGIEAASVAFEPLDWEAAWFSEIEAFPNKVLAHHYPTVPNHGDMTTLPARVLAGEVEAPDVLCGGTPCQAFSIAGLRAGLKDPRGALTLTFCEIANAIDTKRREAGKDPAIIVWENVVGALGVAGNAFGCLLGTLAGEDRPLEPAGGKWSNAGCVYGPQRAIAWRVVDAKYFGVAQRRRRLIVVACPLERAHPTQILFECEGMRRDTAPSRVPGEDVAGCLKGSTGGIDENVAVGGQLQIAFGGNRTSGPLEVSTALNACGTASGRMDFESETFVVQKPTHLFSVHENQQAELTINETMGALGCGGGKPGQGYPAILDGPAVRRLIPVECERLQGFPDFYTDIPGASDSGRYKALGNSWAVPVFTWLGQRIQEHAR